MNIIVPEFVPYLLAILGLLLIWHLHHMQVAAGRIQAVDFWDRSGIRMFVYVTPDDDQTCPSCLEINRLVIAASLAAKKNYSPHPAPCTNPAGCRCQRIGLFGSWPQARRVIHYLPHTKTQSVQLSPGKLSAFIEGHRKHSSQASIDRLSMAMLEGMDTEGTDLSKAIAKYRMVIDQARSPRDLDLVIPAYLRTIDLYDRAEEPHKALRVIHHMEQRFSQGRHGNRQLTNAQTTHISLMKTRLSIALPHAS